MSLYYDSTHSLKSALGVSHLGDKNDNFWMHMLEMCPHVYSILLCICSFFLFSPIPNGTCFGHEILDGIIKQPNLWTTNVSTFFQNL